MSKLLVVARPMAHLKTGLKNLSYRFGLVSPIHV